MNPPILTADQASDLRDLLREFQLRNKASIAVTQYWAGVNEQLDAIATGRTVVVPVMTEAQAREAFVQWWAGTDGTYVDCYLAALRHAGVLK